MEQIFGMMTTILGILMVALALPSQIKKNHNEGRCGLSLLMVALPLSVYVSRALYAITIHSLYILIPDALGIVFSVMIAIQYYHYRKMS